MMHVSIYSVNNRQRLVAAFAAFELLHQMYVLTVIHLGSPASSWCRCCKIVLAKQPMITETGDKFMCHAAYLCSTVIVIGHYNNVMMSAPA